MPDRVGHGPAARKAVNDGSGHSIGDDLLTAVAERLQSVLRPGDTVARFGGDEFAVLLERLDAPAQAEATAQRLLDALAEPSVLAITALVGAFRPTVTRVVDLALGVVLGLVTVLGLLGWLGVLGMSGLADPDNFLHLSTAALALYFGSAAGDPTPADDELDGAHDADRAPERLG